MKQISKFEVLTSELNPYNRDTEAVPNAKKKTFEIHNVLYQPHLTSTNRTRTEGMH